MKRSLIAIALVLGIPRRKSATGLPPAAVTEFLVYLPLKVKLPPSIRALTLFVCIH